MAIQLTTQDAYRVRVVNYACALSARHVTSSKGSLSPYGVETQLSGLAVYPSDHWWWMGSFDCLDYGNFKSTNQIA